MKRLLAIIVFAGCAGASSQAQVIFSQDFNSQTVGATVTGFTAVSPGTATGSGGAGGSGLGAVVNANHGLNLYDYTASSGRVEEDFSPTTSLHLSLDFSRNADLPLGASTTAFYVTLGLNGASQGTQANRAIEFRAFNNGQYRVNRDVQGAGGTFAGASTLTPAANFEAAGPTFGNHTLDLYVYTGVAPGSATMSFAGPDSVARVLDPNSFAVFIDGGFITPSSGATTDGDFGIFNSAFYSAADPLGRLGFVSGGSSAELNIDYNVDNIVLSQIAPAPEPATWALLGFGGALAGFLGRRRS